MSRPAHAVEDVARAVPGVASVEEQSDALRVRLQPGADAAGVALAVGRLLAGDTSRAPRAGLTIPAARRPGRAQIVQLDVTTDGGGFRAAVALSCAGRTASGSARSVVTTTGTRWAAAAATLQAVEGLLPGSTHVELEHVERSDAGGQPVVLVHVSLVCPAGVQRLAGSAVVREEEGAAVVRATLDALNRRIEELVHQRG